MHTNMYIIRFVDQQTISGLLFASHLFALLFVECQQKIPSTWPWRAYLSYHRHSQRANDVQLPVFPAAPLQISFTQLLYTSNISPHSSSQDPTEVGIVDANILTDPNPTKQYDERYWCSTSKFGACIAYQKLRLRNEANPPQIVRGIFDDRQYSTRDVCSPYSFSCANPRSLWTKLYSVIGVSPSSLPLSAFSISSSGIISTTLQLQPAQAFALELRVELAVLNLTRAQCSKFGFRAQRAPDTANSLPCIVWRDESFMLVNVTEPFRMLAACTPSEPDCSGGQSGPPRILQPVKVHASIGGSTCAQKFPNNATVAQIVAVTPGSEPLTYGFYDDAIGGVTSDAGGYNIDQATGSIRQTLQPMWNGPKILTVVVMNLFGMDACGITVPCTMPG